MSLSDIPLASYASPSPMSFRPAVALPLQAPACLLVLTLLLFTNTHAQTPSLNIPNLPEPIQGTPSLMAPLPPDEALLTPAPTASPTPTVTSSTSASKQFIVHGADLKTRSVFCLLADETADSLKRLLKDSNLDRLPIVIVLKTAAEAQRTGPAVSTSISQLAHGGFHLQINVQLRQGFQITHFNNELVRTLLAERILRKHKELSSSRGRVLPDWLLTGVTQALSFRERAKPSVLFAAVFRGGRVYSIDAILQANPSQLDALSRGIYETSSCALVLTLLDQPDGAQRFGHFLTALATDSKSDRDLLLQFFPGLGASENSLEKWWSLQMVTLATPTALETMSVDETERLLKEALTLTYNPEPPQSSKAKPKSKPTPTPKPTETIEEEKEDKPSRFSLPFFKSRKKDIIFPFRKRKEEASEDDEKPSPETNPTPASTEQKIPSLPPKKDATRKLSEHPDLPTDPAPAEEKSGSALNPLNWFRKDSDKPETDSAETPDLPTPPKSSQTSSPSPAETIPPPLPQHTEPPQDQLVSIPLSSYDNILKRSDRGKILQPSIDRLNALRQRGHPLYRPLITQYIDIVKNLMQGKDKGIKERLLYLEQQHQQILSQAKHVETFLDTYIANNSGLSDNFKDYLNLCDQIEQEIHPRQDSIAEYLDTLEKFYQQ